MHNIIFPLLFGFKPAPLSVRLIRDVGAGHDLMAVIEQLCATRKIDERVRDELLAEPEFAARRADSSPSTPPRSQASGVGQG